MVLWFLNFFIWDGVVGIYVEDLFVWLRFCCCGLVCGLLLMLVRECVDNCYMWLVWLVLNWNFDVIVLYDCIGG